MMPNGFDPVTEAAFRATVTTEMRHVFRQIELLWKSNRERKEEIAVQNVELSNRLKEFNRERQEEIAKTRAALAGEIGALRSNINGAIRWAAVAACGVLAGMVRTKLGI